MEALLLAPIVVRNAYKRQESVVPEPHTFQPFDLQALRHLYSADDKSQSRLSARHASYVALAVATDGHVFLGFPRHVDNHIECALTEFQRPIQTSRA